MNQSPTIEPLAPPQVDDQEKSGRELGGWTGHLVAIAAFAVAVLTIWQVFRPLSQGRASSSTRRAIPTRCHSTVVPTTHSRR
ncbi:MAG TPA: hypothetical protein VFL67_04220 [Mycobacterium sp.]|nr:hypothetical protein [Mycobacterium sp.]